MWHGVPLYGGAGDAEAVGWCWSWFLLAALVSPMMVGLRVDLSMLLEPLGFVKVLEWVSGAGGAWGGYFLCCPRPGFAPVPGVDTPGEV